MQSPEVVILRGRLFPQQSEEARRLAFTKPEQLLDVSLHVGRERWCFVELSSGWRYAVARGALAEVMAGDLMLRVAQKANNQGRTDAPLLSSICDLVDVEEAVPRLETRKPGDS